MKIETFYTGGGIWISEYDAGGGYIAVVDSEHPNFMSVYRKSDDDEPYLPENMVYSKEHNELDSVQKELHECLKEELEKHITR